VERAWCKGDELWVDFRPADKDDEIPGAAIHPGLVDSCFQAILAVGYSNGEHNEVFVPVYFDVLHLFRPPSGKATRGHVKILRDRSTRELITADLELVEDTETVMVIKGVRLKHASRQALFASRHASPNWLCEVSWQEEASVPAATRGGDSSFLVLDDGLGFAAAMSDLLRRGGASVRMMKANEANASAVLKEVEHAHGRLEIVNCRALALRGASPSAVLPAPASEGLMLELIRALSTTHAEHAARIWTVTIGTREAASQSALLQTPHLGLATVLAAEHPRLFGGLIVADSTADATAVGEELSRAQPGRVIALGKGKRWTRCLVPIKATTVSKKAQFGEGTYVITGAFGALGVQVARWLASRGARNLLLLSRNAGRTEAHELVRELEAASCRVQATSIDISDLDALQKVLHAATSNMAPIRGIFHIAGTLADGLLERQELKDFESVYRTKVAGSWNLHTATSGMKLDFFVMFSSMSALVGTHAQGNYAAANAFMDGLATLRHREKLPALSLAWGPWGGGGMAAKVANDIYRRWGFIALSPQQGLELLELALTLSTPHVGAVHVDWARLSETARSEYLQALFSRRIASEIAPSRSAPTRDLLHELRATPTEKRTAFLEVAIADMVRAIIGMDAGAEIPGKARLNELGFDSLLTIDLVNALQRVFQVKLPTNLVYERPTLGALAEYLVSATTIEEGRV
jgi:acyl carrier protein